MTRRLREAVIARRTSPLAAALVALVALLNVAVRAPATEVDPGVIRQPRLVALGDVHGDLGALVEILRTVGVIDEQNQWVGDDTVVVETGDFLDRGPDVRAVMDLLMRLEDEAVEAGGQYRVLLGNHETMNLANIWRDVGPAAYEAYVDASSEALRESAWTSFVEQRQGLAKRRRERKPRLGAAERLEFMKSLPPGALEYRRSLGPDGVYGRWLRTLPMAARVGDGVFLHGGIAPEYLGVSLEEINRQAAAAIAGMDRCRAVWLEEGLIHETDDLRTSREAALTEIEILSQQLPRAPVVARRLAREIRSLRQCLEADRSILFDEDSPTWFRGYARWPEEEGAAIVPELLAPLGAQYFAVGHSPRESGRIEQRYDGRVFLMDTGMLAAVYGGQPSALVVRGAAFSAVYPEGESELATPVRLEVQEPAAAEHGRFRDGNGGWLPFPDDAAVLSFLATAEPTDKERTEKGINRPLRMQLSNGSVQAQAVFRTVDETRGIYTTPDGRRIMNFKDSYRFEPAAYIVDQILGLDMVPPATVRRIGREVGSLQLWVHGVVDEQGRREDGMVPKEPLYWSRQVHLRSLFDELIANVDRNQGNILIDTETWKMWLIDHSRAFTEERRLFDPERVSRCSREVYERLRAMNEEGIRARLEGHLTGAQLKGLVMRWQAMVEHLDALIAEKGEDVVLW